MFPGKNIAVWHIQVHSIRTLAGNCSTWSNLGGEQFHRRIVTFMWEIRVQGCVHMRCPQADGTPLYMPKQDCSTWSNLDPPKPS